MRHTRVRGATEGAEVGGIGGAMPLGLCHLGGGVSVASKTRSRAEKWVGVVTVVVHRQDGTAF